MRVICPMKSCKIWDNTKIIIGCADKNILSVVCFFKRETESEDQGINLMWPTIYFCIVSSSSVICFVKGTVEPELKVTPLCTWCAAHGVHHKCTNLLSILYKWRAPHVHIECTLCNLKFSLHCIPLPYWHNLQMQVQ